MDTGIKMLLKAERENWKKRMVKETKGTYIAIYLGLIFSVFMSAMFGFEIARKMLAKGMDAAMVMEITGLSESQLKQLKE